MASLTEREKDRIMSELLNKFKEERLNKEEGEKLKNILEEKQQKAFDVGDFMAAMGMVFVLAGLIGYLSEKV